MALSFIWLVLDDVALFRVWLVPFSLVLWYLWLKTLGSESGELYDWPLQTKSSESLPYENDEPNVYSMYRAVSDKYYMLYC